MNWLPRHRRLKEYLYVILVIVIIVIASLFSLLLCQCQLQHDIRTGDKYGLISYFNSGSYAKWKQFGVIYGDIVLSRSGAAASTDWIGKGLAAAQQRRVRLHNKLLPDFPFKLYSPLGI